jgi:hypothetical protein
VNLFFNFCSFHSDLIQKPQAVVVSAKQLVALFEDAINIQQPNTLGGSTESLKSYYKMIQQFASMAHLLFGYGTFKNPYWLPSKLHVELSQI